MEYNAGAAAGTFPLPPIDSDSLIAALAKRYGPGHALLLSLEKSRSGRLHGSSDPAGLSEAETSIGRAVEPDFLDALRAARQAPRGTRDGLMVFWHGLSLMAANRLDEACLAFEEAAEGGRGLARRHIDPFLTVLRRPPASASSTAVPPGSASPASPAGEAAPPSWSFVPSAPSPLRIPGPAPDAPRMPYQADYAAHPAFRGSLGWDESREPEARSRVEALDAKVWELESALTLRKTGLAAALQSLERPIDDLLAFIASGAGPDFSPYRAIFRRELFFMLAQDLAYFARRNDYVPIIRTPAEMNLRNELGVRGFLEFALEPSELELVRRAFRPYFETLEARLKAGDRGRDRLSVNEIDTEARSLVCAIMERRGFNKAVSDARHERAMAIGMAAEVSAQGTSWWRSRYEDVGIGTGAAAYFHNDESRDIYKAILYLDDVGPQSGPFEYVPASFRIERPRFAWAASRATLTALADPGLQGLMAGGDPERGPFASKGGRRFFGLLPACLRLTSHFGYDLQDGSPGSEALLAGKRTMVAPAGHGIVFDGSRLAHRGGLVREGIRRALQINFEVEKGNGREAFRARYANQGGLA